MKPSIKIISHMKEEEIPSWVIYSKHTRYYYNLTINGKKCYLTWRDENQCMLYVDGFKKPGLDVDNSIHDNLTCHKLFHVSLPKLDHYIGEAVKHFELINGLKGDAKEAWDNILS